jgi:hypothetical protein
MGRGRATGVSIVKPLAARVIPEKSVTPLACRIEHGGAREAQMNNKQSVDSIRSEAKRIFDEASRFNPIDTANTSALFALEADADLIEQRYAEYEQNR